MSRCVVSMVFALALVGCGGSSDDQAQVVREGEEAVQAAVSASVSIATAFEALVDPAGTGIRGVFAGLAASGNRSTSNQSARAVEQPCPAGGFVDGDCRESGGRTVVRSVSRGCAVVDEFGVRTVADGELVATIDLIDVCGGPGIPRGAPATFELRDYSEESSLDGQAFLRIEAGRLVQRVVPEGGGCSPNQGLTSLDGDYRVLAPGFAIGLGMSGLVLDTDSAGSPCTESIVASGRLQIDDPGRGARLVADLDDLRVGYRRGFDGAAEVTLDGRGSIDCVGEVELSTTVELALFGSCPFQGELGIETREQVAEAVFSDGVAFDYGANGSIDFEADFCGSESLTVCR